MVGLPRPTVIRPAHPYTVALLAATPVPTACCDMDRALRVILFGSHAYGEPREGSDFDLLVVVPDPPPQRLWGEIAADLRSSSGFPVQLVFMSPEEFDETRDAVGALAYPDHHWGRPLYEADS